MKTLVCTKCNKEKSLYDFHKNNTRKRRFSWWCKKCRAEHNIKNKDKIKEYHVKYRKNNIQYFNEKNRTWYAQRKKDIRKYKAILIEHMGSKCKMCGYNDMSCLAVFDFHHLIPSEKENTLARIMEHHTLNIETLKIHTKNCILVCANCHRKIHFGEMQVVLPGN